MPRGFVSVFIALFLFIATALPASAQVHPEQYGVTTGIDSAQIAASVKASMDSILSQVQQLGNHPVSYNITRPRMASYQTVDFYLLLLLCLLLGVIRFSDPRYFQLLLRSFRNPSSNRQYKEQIQSAPVSNLVMNLFFAIVTGAYIFYIARVFSPRLSAAYQAPLLLLWLIAGMIGIYLAKYLVIRFSGWAFRVEPITDQYLFNVFLINKITGIVLLPFVVFLAFAGKEWATILVVASLVLVLLLLFNRYVRSWNIFGSFFQYSRFHFFTYLCASEILPMAILVKLILHSLS